MKVGRRKARRVRSARKSKGWWVFLLVACGWGHGLLLAMDILPVWTFPTVWFGLGAFGWLYLALDAFRQIHWAFSIRNWPRTTGKVLSIRIKKGSSSPLHSPEQNETYEPVITYQYVVGGQLWLSKRTCLGEGQSFDTREEAVQRCRPFKPGATVPVYVHPRDPEISFLRVEPAWRTLIVAIVIGLLLFSVTELAAVACFVLRGKR